MNAGTITLVCFLLVSFAGDVLLYEDASIHKANEAAYEQQISNLEQDSKEDTVRYQVAYQQAVDRMTKAQGNVEGILKAKIPSNCNAAMQWLVKRSQRL